MKSMIKDNKYDNLVNTILYCAFFIHQLFFIFSVSEFATSVAGVKRIAQYIIIISFFVMCLTALYYFLRGKFSTKEILIYIILAIPILISLYNYRVVMVVSNLFYVAIFKNVDVDKGLKIALYATILGYAINVLISIFTRHTGNVGQLRYGVSRIRYGLGFRYAYFTGYYYMTIVLIYILAHDRLKIIEYVMLTALNLLVFILSDAKGAFVYTMVALVLHLMFVRFNLNNLSKIFKIFVVAAFPIAALIAILLPAFYVQGNNIWDMLNRILTGRLRLTHNALIDCGWKWFGQTAKLWDPGVHYADSSIVLMLIQNGLIVLIMSIAFMTLFSYMAVKINHKPLMIVLFVIALRSTFDMGFMTMQLCPVIIMFYDVFNKYRSGVVCDY